MTPHCITRYSRFAVDGLAEVHSGNCTGSGLDGIGAGGLGGCGVRRAQTRPVASFTSQEL